MKKSGSPTKPYMCTSDNPKMHSSNMGKMDTGKGYAMGGPVPLPPVRFIGNNKVPLPPVRPPQYNTGNVMSPLPMGKPQGFVPPGFAPMNGDYSLSQPIVPVVTPAQKALDYAKQRKIPDKRA
jgi:hypothetical protein